MKSIISVLLAVIMLGSCKQEKTSNINNNVNPSSEGMSLMAEGIIYDVLIKAEIDDTWEKEKVSGYKGEEMINSLFEAVYSGEIKAIDYFTEEELSAEQLEKLEATDDYQRDKIGKIQFTEDWYFNSSTLEIEKKVRSVVFGYRKNVDDLGRIPYLAIFRLDF